MKKPKTGRDHMLEAAIETGLSRGYHACADRLIEAAKEEFISGHDTTATAIRALACEIKAKGYSVARQMPPKQARFNNCVPEVTKA